MFSTGFDSSGYELSPKLWCNLPLELIREIIVILAETSERKARVLRFISSDVNVLVLPLLFRHLVMATPDHVCRFTATLLPKRKNHIPALKSKLHIMPRLLSSYKVESCILVVNDRRPSIENALASVAPAFCGMSKLAVTGHNLQSNAYWLRQYSIHPTTMMLLHFGSPHLVNFYDPIFRKVSHLYTSITHGHRYSTICDLPSLTHLAVSTRPNLSETTALNVATSLKEILRRCKDLKMLVFLVDFRILEGLHITVWEKHLSKCLEDDRFVFFVDFRSPRMEWNDIVIGDDTIWDRAKEYQALLAAGEQSPMAKVMLQRRFMETTRRRESELEESGFFANYREPEWEVDLVQRDDYHHPQADDPDLRGGGFHSAFG